MTEIHEIIDSLLRYTVLFRKFAQVMKKRLMLCCVAFLGIMLSKGQNVAIGDWTSHLPYNGVAMVVDAGEKVYAANNTSVFAFNKTDNSYDRLSTAAGFSDIDIRGINYSSISNTLVIAYTNSNLDFLFGNEVFNYPFIQSSNISGDKNIYNTTFYGDTAILSCGFGLVLFDVAKRESPATCFFVDTNDANMKVNQTIVYEGNFYAATVNGVFKAAVSEPNLQDFSKWELISGLAGLPEGNAGFICAFNNALFTQVAETLYRYNGSEWEAYFFEPLWVTQQLRATDNYLLLTQIIGPDLPADSNRIVKIDLDGTVTVVSSETRLFYVTQSDIDNDNNLWIADAFGGLIKYNTTFSNYLPNGPASNKVLDMKSTGNLLYVAPGEITAAWSYSYNRDGFFSYDFGNWNNYGVYGFPVMDSTLDIITVEVDPNSNTAWFGSFGGGLLEFNRDANSLVLYKQGYLNVVPGDANSYRVAGLALDPNKNLWIANFGAPDCIVVKKSDGTWKNFNPELPADIENQVAQIAIDEYQTKWFQLARGNGILVFNDNGTLDDESDDLVKVLGAGAGNGNLHTSYINCITVDKQNEVWVGTSEGITIFYNPSEVFSGSTAGDATQPLVNLGGYYEQLLRNDIVNTIAVDGANRKWVGTNSGAFLISDDGTQQLIYFNTDNSPLISNTVLNIEIDPVTGDVYFGTDKGIISYRYTATEGVDEISTVGVFPNPVREDYTGTIAVSGLTENAEIRIADIAGRVIYKTTALGGQAIWDGNGYDGSRAKTGVYLVYSSNYDGSQTVVAKILVIGRN